MTYRLTDEGKEYLERGLPEKNLVKLINASPKKSISITEAGKKIKNFHIALKWAFEKGWVLKKENQLTLVKIPEKTEEENALEKIREGKEVGEEIANILISRNLVIKVTETYKKAEEEIKKSGNAIGELDHDIIITGLWKNRKFKPAEVEVARKKFDKKKIISGKRQPYNQFLMEVKQKLAELAFREMNGPTIETEFWNFDALFQPQNHPARDWTMTYSLKYPKYGKLPPVSKKVRDSHEKSWKYRWDPRKAMQLMPRAHGTALSARTLDSKPELPGKYFAISRCYRPDVIDVKHLTEFNQVEGIVLGKSLTFKNLLGILKMFAIEIAGTNKVKFIPDYYPFTEPSAQLSAKHPELGWMEFGGSGILREEVTKPLGIDVPVLAWGLGIDRLAMFKLNINDIRNLFSQNLEWLRNRKVVK